MQLDCFDTRTWALRQIFPLHFSNMATNVRGQAAEQGQTRSSNGRACIHNSTGLLPRRACVLPLITCIQFKCDCVGLPGPPALVALARPHVAAPPLSEPLYLALNIKYLREIRLFSMVHTDFVNPRTKRE